MNHKNKKITTYFVILSLLLIGIIYAILQANLQINGTAKIGGNTWDIHFDNIQVNENSVSIGIGDSAAVIDSENNCKIDFEVTLSTPGDFYEFTVDVVNAGTINGMIGELNKTIKVNNEAVDEVPNYLDYSVTYSDGVEILPNHGLNAGTTETYLVRLEFKSDIEELPEAATVETTLEPQYIQADSNVIVVNHPVNLYNVFQTEASNGNGYVVEFTGTHKDSFTTTGTQKIYHWYADYDDNDSANVILDKWNVIFGGFCWQMIRTTDTGGVKLLYNGVPSDGQCTASGSGQQIGSSQFNSRYYSPAYVGYKYGTVYESVSTFGNSLMYAPDVSYDSTTGMYTLQPKWGYSVVSKSTIDGTKLNYHHYTCNSSTETTCSTVFYVFRVSNGAEAIYIKLTNGKKVEDALADMFEGNTTDSVIKTKVDTWYQDNMTAYTSKLEDTIFCTDRSINKLGGWNPNGGDVSSAISFNIYKQNDLTCEKVADQFCMSNQNAQLIYPVGLMTVNEVLLLRNNLLRRISGSDTWLGTPDGYYQKATGNVISRLNYYRRDITDYSSVRPAVSLKADTWTVSGDGSKTNPYIVE